MKKQTDLDEQEIYENRAHTVKNSNGKAVVSDETDCEDCREYLVFALRDKHHEFSLGLHTVLECLKIAEANGYVPELSDDWWLLVKNQYF